MHQILGFERVRLYRKSMIYGSLLVAGLGLSWFLLWGYLRYLLRFDFLRSDVLAYWQDSYLWRTPYNTVHVPGYPIVLALLRPLGELEPLPLMWLVVGVSWFLGIWLFLQCIGPQTGRRTRTLGIVVFAFWPFVGATYVVYPLADSPAICIFLFGVLLSLKRRLIAASVALGLAVLFHKAIWPFAGLTLLALLISNASSSHWSKLVLAICAAITPTAILWIAGSQYYSSLGWMLNQSLQNETASQNGFPILDGLVGTVLTGKPSDLLKAMWLWFSAIVAGGLLVSGYKRIGKDDYSWYGLAIAGGILFLSLTLNQNTIWAVMRFGKLLALPMVWFWGSRLETTRLTRSQFRFLLVALLFVLLASQFIYAWYLAMIFFA